jgi:hypothetical protein
MSIVHTGIRHPSSIMKNVIPIVMAGGVLDLFWDIQKGGSLFSSF